MSAAVDYSARREGVVALCLWLLGYAARRKAMGGAVLAMMLLKIGLDVLRPWPIKVLFDNVLGEKPMDLWLARTFAALPGDLTPMRMITWAVVATVVIFLAGWVVTAVWSVANLGFGQRLAYDLAGDVFGHLQRVSLRFHTRQPTGDLIRRVTRDSSSISVIVKDALLPAISSVGTLAVMFVVLYQLNVALTLAALCVVPLIAVVLRLYSRVMLERSYAQEETDARLYTVVEQTLGAMPIVQAFTREQAMDERFAAATRQSLAATMHSTAAQVQFRFLIGLATALGTALILFVGGREVVRGNLTVGGMIVFLEYLAALYAPLEALAYTGSTVQGAAGSARRVREILASEPEVAERHGASPLPAARGEVSFHNVTFGYDRDRPILRGVTLQAVPGQTVAIVGSTGAGKSTLVGLIPRFFDPWEGKVTLDGHDVKTLKLRDLRERVSLVIQESFLFPVSIAENIAYGHPGATREQVIAAATAANADAFISRLPEGYDTVVGERGSTLSGGERQRIAIARAILKDAPVLILDEPTAALDTHTEHAVMEALARLTQGRTTFIIAHRLSTVRRADVILVLEHGHIVEQGTHEQLVAAGGLYARLYEVWTSEPEKRA